MTRFSETHCILLYNGPSLRSFMCPLKCHKIGLAKIVRWCCLESMRRSQLWQLANSSICSNR